MCWLYASDYGVELVNRNPRSSRRCFSESEGGASNVQSRPVGEVGLAEDEVIESRRSKLVP